MDRACAISPLHLLVLAAVLYEASAVSDRSLIENACKMVRGICQPRSGSGKDAIDGIKKGKFPDDDKLKEYCLCVLEILRVMRNDRFEPDAGLENIDKFPEPLREPLTQGINKCRKADEGNTTGRDLAYIVVQCLYKAVPDNKFIFP